MKIDPTELYELVKSLSVDSCEDKDNDEENIKSFDSPKEKDGYEGSIKSFDDISKNLKASFGKDEKILNQIKIVIEDS